jgi:NAD(P) transhydrogenase
MQKHYDLVILGSGPGGEGAAMAAAKGGKKVAVVDKLNELGGGCVHWGTIPSKMLRHMIQQYAEMRENPLFASACKHLDISYPAMLNAANKVVDQQTMQRHNIYGRNDVELFDGHARFLDPHTVEVECSGKTEQLHADHFILAVGSSPYRPADVDFTHPRIFDANTILGMQETPHSLTIYGAGVVGCEYASIFRGLGCKINLINTHDRLLSFLDDEITDALSYHLRDNGVLIRHNEEYERIEPQDDGVILHMKSGKRIKSQFLLWANGRTGNTDRLNLNNAGLTTNKRKQIDVNPNYQTKVPHIYAVGDVVGFPALASASYDQGRFAAAYIVTGKGDPRFLDHMPSGIYTSPEISSIGRTERDLTGDGVPYEVGHALFRSLARAQIVNVRVGMLKLLFHSETYEILGIHCFGYQAAEIVHIGQAIMSQSGVANDIRYFADTTFNYPTMAEAYRVAALNGLNRLVSS